MTVEFLDTFLNDIDAAFEYAALHRIAERTDALDELLAWKRAAQSTRFELQLAAWAARDELPRDDDGRPDVGEYTAPPARARTNDQRLERALERFEKYGEIPADRSRYAASAWYLFRHGGRPEFERFARALYAHTDYYVRIERPPLGPPRSIMEEEFLFGDEISLRPQPLAGEHHLDAIARAALEKDERPQISRLSPKAAKPAKSLPARYDDVDTLARQALWVDTDGNLHQTTDLQLLLSLRDSASVELQIESDAALRNVRDGYGLCLYDPDRDANSLMRSAFDGPDSEVDALMLDDLDDDEAEHLATEPLPEGDAFSETTLRFAVEYETATGFHTVHESVRIDPEELIARYRRRQLERVFVTAEDRFEVNTLADYFDREDKRPIAKIREEADATGEGPEAMRPARRGDGTAQQLTRLSRLQELRAIHVWASCRASMVEAWKAHPLHADYPTPEAWEADWAPESMTTRREHLALVQARAEAIAEALDEERAEEYVAYQVVGDDLYADSWG